MTITIEDLRNPARKSGFNYVALLRDGRRKPFQAQRGHGSTSKARAWIGLCRETAEQAAQDYCGYVNGLPSAIVTHKARAGRPDWARLNGVLHVDKPGVRRRTLAHPTRGAAPEREMIERMTPRMAALMEDGDIAEAKAGIGRQAIVTGVGQLLLRHFELGPAGGLCYLVLPEQPRDADIIAWLNHLGITLIVEGQ